MATKKKPQLPKKAVVKKAAAKKTVAKKAIAKKTVAEKVVTKKAVTKKAAVKKTGAKKAVAKKAVARKVVTKKAVTKKAAVKKAVVKKSVAKKKASESRNGKPPRLRIRMYRHGLGDCLLLRFAKEDKSTTFNVLIDCGLIMVASDARTTMENLVKDIHETCAGKIDLVVMTHEHWDHASGFSKQQGQALFDQIEVEEVWYAWTEDPTNALGKRLRKERAEKVSALSNAVSALHSVTNNPLAVARAEQASTLLGFFGIDLAAAKAKGGKIGKTREAFEYLKNREGTKIKYCYPTKAPAKLSGVSNLRVYSFCPPEDESLIKKSAPSKSKSEVYEFAAQTNLVGNLDAAFSRLAMSTPTGTVTDNEDCPFDSTYQRSIEAGQSLSAHLQDLVESTWNYGPAEWRKIDLDWTNVIEGLALDLDSHTNNTCLVLAFEFSDTGEVFLFPADAQVGNWLSWQSLQWKMKVGDQTEFVTANDLLSRTVFYKVGHHGSHNATLRSLGLELMTSDELIAFIPVIKDQAMKSRWKEMPFDPLVKRLKEKTKGRLLRSDDVKAPTQANLSNMSKSAKAKFIAGLDVGANNLFYEFTYD